MTIINDYITGNRPMGNRPKTTAIAIHYIGNPNTSAKNNRNYFDTNSNYVSANYIIGLDGEVICCIPPDEISWATAVANQYSPSIECCHPDSTGKLNSKTYRSLVELCVYLCNRYKLNETNLIRHFDVTGKVCPRGFVPKSKGGTDDNNNTAWLKLKADVKALLTPTTVLDSDGYKVGSNTIGCYLLKRDLLRAKALGLTRYGMDNNGKFGKGTQNAVNDLLSKWGYKPNGIAGRGFITRLSSELDKKV